MRIIRPFEEKDIQDCAALHQLSRCESEKGIIFDDDLNRDDLDHFLTNWQSWSKDESMSILISHDTSFVITGLSIAGKIKTRPDFDKGVVPRYGAEIYALYIHPNYFRQGIGKALFIETCKNLSQQNLNSMLLWTYKKNKRAGAFYEMMNGQRIAKKRVDIGEKSWAEESCFGWKDLRKII